MTNGEYEAAKKAVNEGRALSAETMKELRELNDQFVKEIRRCAMKNDIARAMFFRAEQMEILGVIHRAEKLAKEE